MDYKLSFKPKIRIFEQPQVLIYLLRTNIVTDRLKSYNNKYKF